MTRAQFTPEMQKRIAARIDEVPPHEVVTWPRVLEFAAEIGLPLTRQWLCKSSHVRNAYRRHLEASRLHRRKSGVAKGRSSEAETLRKEVIRLRGLLADSDKRFLRWLHNATQRKLTIEQLEIPVPELEV